MTSSYVNPNTGEKTCYSYNHFGTTEGEIRFGDVMTNGTKMAVMIRRIFPNTFLCRLNELENCGISGTWRL